MDLLYANDQPGAYPDSWYAATAEPEPPRPTLRSAVKADVCVVGGGYTGLSAALHLAQAGLSVVLLEAHRAGFGASGRNGGQLGSGQRVDQQALEKMVGEGPALAMWELGQDAKALVKDLIRIHNIDCHLKPGVVSTGSTRDNVADLHQYADHLQSRYGYKEIEKLGAAACHAICPSPDYNGGLLDTGAAHLHPLAFALGLARAAEKAGVQIFEQSRVVSVDQGTPALVTTEHGQVTADYVILGCNGYLSGFAPSVTARVMPINNFIVATEPLGEAAEQVLARDVAVADSRFVVNYFRLSHDKRLLFGGGESYGYRFPADIPAVVRKPMNIVFPHLRDIRIDYAWGGTLGITMKRFPCLTRITPNILSASGYSGHGVGTATHSGKLMADLICGDAAGFDVMSSVPTNAFPGGGALRTPLLILAMTWYSLRDRFSF